MGTASSPSASAVPAGARPRPLWQVPVFLIGVAALMGAWFMHDPADDGADAYDLLCRAYMQLTPPDYQKALDANTKLREQPVLPDDLLAKAQLRSGELKLKLGHTEEARKDLELIGPTAPGAVAGRAR